MKAIWNGQVIAESDDIITVEGNAYFPPESLHREFLRPSDHTSVCPWKGTARYCSIEAGGQINKDAAWYYLEPKEAASSIRGRIAFWRGVEIVP